MDIVMPQCVDVIYRYTVCNYYDITIDVPQARGSAEHSAGAGAAGLRWGPPPEEHRRHQDHGHTQVSSLDVGNNNVILYSTVLDVSSTI